MPTTSETQPLIFDAEAPERERLPSLSAGLRIIAKDLQYTVKSSRTKGRPLQLLKNVTGYFDPGQMAALIGPSGSGKTTLVDVLSGRKTQGETEGVILYGNQKPTPVLLKRYVGYVEQFDVLIESLTVEEMLMYTAELKRPMNESYEDKQRCVQVLIEKLMLHKSRNRRIGSQGGVKKRVNIGIALISNPKVLFLDEPTTGLDSYTANETMTVVKNMALDGTTICSTIHSPTPYTFGLFDKVLFILGGLVVFFGETKNALKFLNGFAQGMINVYDNDADWLTMIIVRADRENRGPEIAEAFAQSSYMQEVHSLLGSMESSYPIDATPSFLFENKESTSIPRWFAFKTLIKYRTMKILKVPSFWISRLADKFTFLFLLLLTYHGVGDNFEFPAMQNIVSVCFMLVCFPLLGAGVYAPSLVVERSLMYREMSDGMYTTSSYLLMKLVDEMIVGIFSTIVITSIAWKILALQGNYVYLVLVYFGNLINGIAAAYIFAAVGPNVTMLNALLATYTALLMFFAGMLILPSLIPDYWKWMHTLDYAKYGFGVLMYNTFTSTDEARDAHFDFGLVSISPLVYYELEDIDLKWWTGIIFLFVVGHLILAYLCTRFIRHQKR